VHFTSQLAKKKGKRQRRRLFDFFVEPWRKKGGKGWVAWYGERGGEKEKKGSGVV